MCKFIETAKSRKLTLLSVWIAFLCVCLGGVLYHQHHRYKHFAVHEDGRMIRSGWVEPDVVEELARKYKIQTIVNLCDGGEKLHRIEAEREAAEAAGAKLVELEFPANDTWTTNYASVAEFEKLIEDPNAFPMWIHCWHGKERTVKALAIYDIRKRGMTANDSLDRMPLFGTEHPWPIVVFAHNYETLHDHRLAQGTEDSTNHPGHEPAALPHDPASATTGSPDANVAREGDDASTLK